MAALLQTQRPMNTQASILYGSGNSKITDQEIRDFINTPGRTDAQVQAKAVEQGVSANQISTAMSGNKGYSPAAINRHLSEQGISPEQYEPAQIKAPGPIAPQPLVVNKSTDTIAAQPLVVNNATDTVAGRMDGILKDPNSPLLQQAHTYGIESANRRGLLNSSIAASAGESALINAAMPIATQDATTSYDANRSNVANKLTADTFNATTSYDANRSNVANRLTADTFNADTQARVGMNNSNIDANKYIASMDTDTKIKIANINAVSNDSSIMGQMSSDMRRLIAETTANKDMTPEVKNQLINDIVNSTSASINLLPSFDRIKKLVDFSSPANGAAPAANGAVPAATGAAPTAPAASKSNALGYQVEPAILGKVADYEKVTGSKVDRASVAPEALVMDFKMMGSSPLSGVGYTASDGTNKMTNSSSSYDIPSLLTKYGVKYPGELFEKMFAAVHPPGSMRADNPMFYVYR